MVNTAEQQVQDRRGGETVKAEYRQEVHQCNMGKIEYDFCAHDDVSVFVAC